MALLRNHAARHPPLGIAGIGFKSGALGTGLGDFVNAETTALVSGGGARFGDVFAARAMLALREFGAGGGQLSLGQGHRRRELLVIQSHQ